MNTLDKVLYTARVHTTGGGRDGGRSTSDDGHLDVTHTRPGAGGGTNPEQLFAAGYSACFIGALKAVAAKQQPVVTAGVRTIFAHTEAKDVAAQWDQVANTFDGPFPKAFDMISHDQYGLGKVTDAQDKGRNSVITVDFGSAGVKRLMLRVAPIEKL